MPLRQILHLFDGPPGREVLRYIRLFWLCRSSFSFSGEPKGSELLGASPKRPITAEQIPEAENGRNKLQNTVNARTNSEPSKELVLRIADMLPEEDARKERDDDQDDGAPN